MQLGGSQGLTRQILLDCFRNTGKLDELTEQKFLDSSPYLDRNESLRSGCSLKDFYDLTSAVVHRDPKTGESDELLLTELLMREFDKLTFQSNNLAKSL